MIMDDYFGFNEDTLSYRNRTSLLENVEGIECPLNNVGLMGLWTTTQIDSMCRRLDEATALDDIRTLDMSGGGGESSAIYERFEGVKDRLHDWFEKARETFKKIWQYVKGFFMKAFKILESIFATNHKFLKDNRDLLSVSIKAGTLGKITFSGYKYTIGSVSDSAVRHIIDIPIKDLVTSRSGINTMNLGKIKTLFDAVDTNSMTALYALGDKEPMRLAELTFIGYDLTRIRDDLFRELRSGKSSKLEIKGNQAYSSVDALIKAMDDKNSMIKEVNQLYKDAKEDIDSSIESIDEAEAEALKNANTIPKSTKLSKENLTERPIKIERLFKFLLKMMEFRSKVLNVAHSEYIKAIKGNASQAKSVARQLIIHGTKIKDLGKGGKFTESTDFII